MYALLWRGIVPAWLRLRALLTKQEGGKGCWKQPRILARANLFISSQNMTFW